MERSVHEVDDGEIVFAFKQTCAAPYYLLEFNHTVYGTHQHDIAHVQRINTCAEFLACCEDCRDCFLVVLELLEILFAYRTVVRGHTHAIINASCRRHLVDVVAHSSCVGLIGAEHDCLFARIYVG